LNTGSVAPATPATPARSAARRVTPYLVMVVSLPRAACCRLTGGKVVPAFRRRQENPPLRQML
jgi:hypothetical protein